MMRRFIKDEDGVALGLAVILIVIVGVMGAGLLVFVRNDLEAVVEVNRGEKAFNIADAGVQAAKQQLLMDARRQHYDRDPTNDSTPEPRLGDDWSPQSGGVIRTFAGGKFNVTIQCLNQTGDPTPSPCSGVSESAPESAEASESTFFKVVSTGYYPADESGAKRKIEAIFSTSDANVPEAYYTPGDIEFSGNVDISGVSFFSQGNIIGSNSGSVSIDRGPATPYGDWDTRPESNYNTEPRTDDSGNSVEGAGLAAEGVICDGNDCTTSVADGEYDYDSTTGPQFYRKPEASLEDPNDSGITYPFNPYKSYDLDLLKSIAMSQSGNSGNGNNYYSVSSDKSLVKDGAGGTNKIEYPDVSTSSTVVYIGANGNDITYKVNDTIRAKGIVVIENGNLKMGNSSNGFKGAFIVTAGDGAAGTYKNSGNETVEGFVVADSKMTISGGASPYVADAGFTRQPGNYNVEQWSWRELYE
jgi:hypothetical protein